MPFRNLMQEALLEADKAAAAGEVPVGAVIVLDGQVIARAHNLRESRNDPTAHAEILAIRAASESLGRWRLSGCTMYVTLEPCPMCAGALVQARMDAVVYGCDDARAGACGTLLDITRDPRLNHRLEVFGGVMEEECRAVLTGFFESRRGSASAEETV